MRVGIYARVSTREQNAETQLRDLRQYCQARSWQIVRECVDVGISGFKDDRPALNELMADARRRRFDILLVWRFDRFARSLVHLINCLKELHELGVGFVSYSESLDTSTSQGRLVFSLVGAIAEFERDLIRERIAAGMRRVRAEGKQLGRPPKQWDVDYALQMQREGRSLREIAAETHVPVTRIFRAFQKVSKELINGSDGERRGK